MSDRKTLKSDFLAKAGWASANVSHLAGDASARSYERLSRSPTETAILMDAPPERGEDTQRFVEISEFLLRNGFSAPQIFAADHASGFLLLEDFGDAIFAKKPDTEDTLYKCAIDVLLSLHKVAPKPGLPICDPHHLGRLGATALIWYTPEAQGIETELSKQFASHISMLAEQISPKTDVMILRDYHAENLILLPDRNGIQKAGLLDFQDAMLGHSAFDLVSLLQDARRDITPEFEQEMIAYFLSKSGKEKDGFLGAYAFLGAVRNLRIIGMFARLSLHLGRTSYLNMIPRVWIYLERDLAHPQLEGLQRLCVDIFPKPTRDYLERLKDRCGTLPNP